MLSNTDKVIPPKKSSTNHTPKTLSLQIEDLLVEKDLRGMKFAQSCLKSGYYYRAAKLINKATGTVLIGTGFPVLDTFETDGPVGAIVLYNAFLKIGLSPVLVCGEPLYSALIEEYDCLRLNLDNNINAEHFAKSALADIEPSLLISIERPGLTLDGTYRNMFGDDITARCASFDDFFNFSICPSIGIGDGGNEIGMGNISHHLTSHNIMTSQTCCDELLVADVSNWAAYGILGLLSLMKKEDLLADVNPLKILKYLSSKGSVDGVTKLNTLTEDSLSYTEGLELINKIRTLCGFQQISNL